MPKLGYKQSQEHKQKTKKTLISFKKGFDKRRELNRKDKEYYQKNRDAILEKRSVQRLNNPTMTREKHLKKKYNLTLGEYNVLFDSQNGLCAICNKPEARKNKHLAVDHNHSTGKVRGLLCVHCNVALGFIKEDTSILDSMKNYINKFKN